MNRPLVLIILGGWGYAPPSKANAIALARKPNYDRLLTEFPNTLIHTSGRFVGLPQGQMGNSEVGHLNIGAGRIVYMDITKIDVMIEKSDLYSNSVLMEAMKSARSGGRQLHLCGLLSDGGVHSHQNHLYALLRMAKQSGIDRTYVHCFMDGRDTLPTNGAVYLQQLQQKMRELGGKIASVSGRYYAMDRDKKWDRELKAFDAMVAGKAEGGDFVDPVQGVKDSYNRDVTDEFIIPFTCVDNRGQAVATIRDDDSVINFNFRADRARQITRCLARESGLTAQAGRDLPDAEALDAAIPRERVPRRLKYTCMSQYDKQFTLPYVVTPDALKNILANVMAEHQLRNLRVAETEKYAHVTYFFNGGVEKPFPGEDRKLIPSPKVATYDLKPEMSAFEVTDEVLTLMANYDLIVLNFANPDMVGHTGVVEAGIKAVETVDACCARIIPKLLELDGKALVTADHGNCEQMRNPDGSPHTSHTSYLVHLIYVANDAAKFRCENGILADVAPTLLFLLGLPQPKEMTGHNLLVPV